jgi:hypothetical protein
MAFNKLHREIEALDEFCASVLRDPWENALVDKPVGELAAEKVATGQDRQWRRAGQCAGPRILHELAIR